MAITQTKSTPSTWEISLLWVGVNAFSILGGILFGAFLNEILWASHFPSGVDNLISILILIDNPIQRALIYGLSIGSIKSLLEGFVLRKYKVKWNGWIPASALGWAFGVTVATALPMLGPVVGINQLLGGMIVGLSQWIVLKRYLPKAYWWIIASTIGSFAILSYVPLGYTFFMMLEGFVLFIIAGLFLGIMTGATLSWLLTLSWLEEM